MPNHRRHRPLRRSTPAALMPASLALPLAAQPMADAELVVENAEDQAVISGVAAGRRQHLPRYGQRHPFTHDATQAAIDKRRLQAGLAGVTPPQPL